MALPPDGADTVVVSPHVVVTPGSCASTRPVGRLSVNAHPVFALSSLVFVIVKVNVLVSPTGTEVGLKDLSSWGVTSRTRMLSIAPSLPPPRPWALVILMLNDWSLTKKEPPLTRVPALNSFPLRMKVFGKVHVSRLVGVRL